jgi:hypothetical protein
MCKQIGGHELTVEEERHRGILGDLTQIGLTPAEL